MPSNGHGTRVSFVINSIPAMN